MISKNESVEALNKLKEFDARIKSRPNSFVATKQMILGVFANTYYRMKPRPYQPRTETFTQTVKKEGLTEEDLKAIYANYIIKVVLSVLFSLACLGSSAYVFGVKGLSLTGFVPLVFFVYFVLQSAVQSHKAFQVRNKKYMTFKEYFNNGQYF